MGLLSSGPFNRILSVASDGDTVTVTVENNREIRIPRDLLHPSIIGTPLIQDAWECGQWDHSRGQAGV